ncbi:uncharacterized protein LOC110445039, partial [Mizuhopecten yessoensis]|uniref:uncharacterized protein LOC110445039 n=1 Tax=Mizuhopecten yessoensis TaxID=6573 RepID=UPI000B45F7D5
MDHFNFCFIKWSSMDPLKCHECAATGLISAIRLDKCYHIFCMKCERRLPVTEQIHKSQHFRNCYKCSVCGLYCQLDSTTQLKNQELQRSRGLNVPDSRRRREDHSSTTHGKLPSHPEPAYWTPNDTVQNKRIEEKDRRMMATMKTSSKSNDDSYR